MLDMRGVAAHFFRSSALLTYNVYYRHKVAYLGTCGWLLVGGGEEGAGRGLRYLRYSISEQPFPFSLRFTFNYLIRFCSNC